MKTKHAGSGAALVVVLGFLGLIVLVGVIIFLMSNQFEIEHSPSKHQTLANPVTHSDQSFWRVA